VYIDSLPEVLITDFCAYVITSDISSLVCPDVITLGLLTRLTKINIMWNPWYSWKPNHTACTPYQPLCLAFLVVKPPVIGIPHPPYLTIDIVAHTHVDQELLSHQYWYHDKLNQGILITTIMTPKQQPFVQPGVYLNEFLPSFWQRQINAAEQETPDYRHPLLPLARIKKVMKSDPDVKVRT